MLLLDGPDMEKHEDKSIEELLLIKTVHKCVYAGMCLNEEIRSTHFTADSSINKLLSKTSQLYFLRKRSFKNLKDCRADEAVMIVSMQT